MSMLKLDKSYNFVDDKRTIIYLIMNAIDESPYSPKRVSELAGLWQATVNNWINKRVRNPHSESIQRVAEVLGLHFELVPNRPAQAKPEGAVVPFTPRLTSIAVAVTMERAGRNLLAMMSMAVNQLSRILEWAPWKPRKPLRRAT